MSKQNDDDSDGRDDQSSRTTQVYGVGGDGRCLDAGGGIPRPFNLMIRQRQLPASRSSDQRQPYRLRQARRTPMSRVRCRRRSPRSTRTDAAGFHDPHRGHHALAKPEQFDNADRIIRGANCRFTTSRRTRRVDDDGKGYLERYGKGTTGLGWYSFDEAGVHFIGLINVMNFKAGGLGNLGQEQICVAREGREGAVREYPIVIFATCRCGRSIRSGLGTGDARRLSPMSSGSAQSRCSTGTSTRSCRGGGHITFQPRDRPLSATGAGKAKAPGPLTVPADQLKQMLGLRAVTTRRHASALHQRHDLANS